MATTDGITINGRIPGAGRCVGRDCISPAGHGRIMCDTCWRLVPAVLRRYCLVAYEAYDKGHASLGELRRVQVKAVEACEEA